MIQENAPVTLAEYYRDSIGQIAAHFPANSQEAQAVMNYGIDFLAYKQHGADDLRPLMEKCGKIQEICGDGILMEVQALDHVCGLKIKRIPKNEDTPIT